MPYYTNVLLKQNGLTIGAAARADMGIQGVSPEMVVLSVAWAGPHARIPFNYIGQQCDFQGLIGDQITRIPNMTITSILGNDTCTLN